MKTIFNKEVDVQGLTSNIININAPYNEASNKQMTFVDLFCGCGGVSKGFVDCGFEPISAVDFNHAACATHRRNIDCEVIEGDITLEEMKIRLYETVISRLGGRELDILHASPPCQGFSMAGKRRIDDPRNRLYKEAVEIIGRLRPRWITMENVPGMVSMAGGEIEKQIIKDLEGLGYNVGTAILNAADYGTPQMRKRWILIGNRIGKPVAFPIPLLDKDHYITVGEAIGDLVDKGEDKAFNHVFTHHTEAMKDRLASVEEGHSLYGYCEGYKKSPWDKPSCTVKENHGGVNIHPKLPRVITPREMARLQSFPDDFIFCGNVSEQRVQIGNAVPPRLAKAVGLSIAHVDSLPRMATTESAKVRALKHVVVKKVAA